MRRTRTTAMMALFLALMTTMSGLIVSSSAVPAAPAMSAKVAGPAPRAAPDAPGTFAWRVLRSWDSGKCMDVRGGSNDPGAPVHLWTCLNVRSQFWTWVPTGDGYNYIVDNQSGRCLDVYAAADWTPVQQWTCLGNWNQQWRFDRIPGTSDGIFIINRYSGKCLDLYYGQTGDGTTIQLYSCHGGHAQWWWFGST
jgi:hypothetical protein